MDNILSSSNRKKTAEFIDTVCFLYAIERWHNLSRDHFDAFDSPCDHHGQCCASPSKWLSDDKTPV